jgi:hypothetical protein
MRLRAIVGKPIKPRQSPRGTGPSTVEVVSGARISIIRGRTRGPELTGPRAASLKLRRKFRKRSGLVGSGLETS